MTLVEALPVGPGVAQWPLWSTTARLVVTDPAVLATARAAVEGCCAAVDRAASRFRPDSELARLPRDGRPVAVSPVLAELVAAGLRAAERTDGDVDPALGSALAGIGYDRTIALVGDGPLRLVAPAGPAWHRVRLAGCTLTVPAGTELDLGAVAKAVAADRCAAAVVTACGGGAVVALGGDVATAGDAPDGGWQVQVCDGPDEPACTVTLDPGGALATSSTISRAWRRAGRAVHHIVVPRTGAPAPRVWRTVSVAAGCCEVANTVTTAAIVRGLDALPWIRELGLPARLVGATGKVVRMGGWP